MSVTLPRYIVDASIAIKWLLDDEDLTLESREILFEFQEGQIDLLAPDHLYYEVLNALRTVHMMRMGRLDARDAEDAVHSFLSLAIPTVALVPDSSYRLSIMRLHMIVRSTTACILPWPRRLIAS